MHPFTSLILCMDVNTPAFVAVLFGHTVRCVMNAAALRDLIEELVSERKPNPVECEMVTSPGSACPLMATSRHAERCARESA